MKIEELNPAEVFVNSLNGAVGLAQKSGVSNSFIVSSLEFLKTSIILDALTVKPVEDSEKTVPLN